MLKKNCKIAIVIYLSLIIISVLLCACGGQQTQKNESPVRQAALPPSIPELDKKYHKIICYKFVGTPDIEKKYSKEIAVMQDSMMASLKAKSEFEIVDMIAPGQEYDSDTLLVKADVNTMRIVGFWKRGFVMWQRSSITLDLEFIDGATKKSLSKEPITSANNPVGAYFGWGHSDRALPSNMGKILAEYIALAMPSNKL